MLQWPSNHRWRSPPCLVSASSPPSVLSLALALSPSSCLFLPPIWLHSFFPLLSASPYFLPCPHPSPWTDL
ncbi:hypothetical protein BDW74DRAFT_12542 [Aspergillus multicolor]|uniref:uncharacterized protein n=1 Tax=Aspergillus multicolor TaxID=41759 RepID=UPI003CCD2A02